MRVAVAALVLVGGAWAGWVGHLASVSDRGLHGGELVVLVVLTAAAMLAVEAVMLESFLRRMSRAREPEVTPEVDAATLATIHRLDPRRRS